MLKLIALNNIDHVCVYGWLLIFEFMFKSVYFTLVCCTCGDHFHYQHFYPSTNLRNQSTVFYFHISCRTSCSIYAIVIWILNGYNLVHILFFISFISVYIIHGYLVFFIFIFFFAFLNYSYEVFDRKYQRIERL